MPFVSITRLKIRSLLYFISFARANSAALKELVTIKGFIAGKELTDKGLTFWTLTLWDDDRSMLQFRNSASHRKAMQRLPDWCNEASYFHWNQEQNTLPGWIEASGRLITEGKLTKVRHPTQRHLSNNFPPIKWTKLERIIKPKVQ